MILLFILILIILIYLKNNNNKLELFANRYKIYIINLEKDYKIQVNPRDINLFYLTENSRERIIENEGKYTIHNTDLVFSEAEIFNELENHTLNSLNR